MNMIRCFSRSLHRGSRCKTKRWYSAQHSVTGAIALCILLSLFSLFFYSVLIYHCCTRTSDVIVSLTTTTNRFQYELPLTVHSLLSQTVLPKEIRIYLSPAKLIINQTNVTLAYLKRSLARLDSSATVATLFDRLVKIQFEQEDYGPATKFLPILREFHGVATSQAQSQLIMVCDDDHYYHPHTIGTLYDYASDYKTSIIGLRGWRIREDLTWGVSGDKEISLHIIESFRLSEAYRVGIVTANYAYLLRPSFFDSHIYLDFNQTSNEIRRMDDIWLNGYASKRNISRWVVPSCCRNIGVTRTHELENYLIAHQTSRSSANDHALQQFGQTWEKHLWYRFHGENPPNYRSWWQEIYREWINVVLRVKFILYFGLI